MQVNREVNKVISIIRRKGHNSVRDFQILFIKFDSPYEVVIYHLKVLYRLKGRLFLNRDLRLD